MNKKINSFIKVGVLSAITTSLCCITPVLALVSGISGIASNFSWMEPARPYLFGITVLVLSFAWYHKLKPRTTQEMQCACEYDKNNSFWQSKIYLGMVTVFASVMLAFPYYSDAFYPEIKLSNAENINPKSNYEISISGMTCAGCEEHVKFEIGKLPGISGLEVSYKKGNAVVRFDESKTDIEEVKTAINKTGYKVESVNKEK